MHSGRPLGRPESLGRVLLVAALVEGDACRCVSIALDVETIEVECLVRCVGQVGAESPGPWVGDDDALCCGDVNGLIPQA